MQQVQQVTAIPTFTQDCKKPGSRDTFEQWNHSPLYLDLTCTVARELTLLARLIGWGPLIPGMLEIARRPRQGANDINISEHFWLSSTLGGLDALKVLRGEQVHHILGQLMLVKAFRLCIRGMYSFLCRTTSAATCNSLDKYKHEPACCSM